MPKTTYVAGVGINDAPYRVLETEVDNGKHVIVARCPFYGVWASMINRCYRDSAHKHRPNYKGCSVANDWLTFSKFRKWMEKQDWQGKALDKDILVPGNRFYGPETCVFVDQMTNSFFAHNTTEKVDRGTFKRGDCNGRPYMAYCGNPITKKSDRLGCYATMEEAAEVRRAHKHKIAMQLAEMQTDERVANALKTRFV
jgi:hypothetical protein|uniref:DNA binding protein n=1 Tax=Myoviridae sp. ctshb19 TaxID=2825194 RepID=A0A8S5UH51_9CAUD|nr:MAG TPA: hypothetical protein [Myoviridae sp. ctshb19]